MRESRTEEELEQAEKVYDGLVQTRRSLGTMLAETIRQGMDLEEFGRHLRDLPLLIQQADLRRTELRHELLGLRAKRAEEEYRRAAEEASTAARALEKSRRAYVKAEETARRSGLEARRLAEQRDKEAEHLQELLRVPEDAQVTKGITHDKNKVGNQRRYAKGGRGAQAGRQQGEERIQDPRQAHDRDMRATSGADIAGENADRKSADVTTDDAISLITVGVCVMALAACVLAYLLAT
jgi:hypothetical protein